MSPTRVVVAISSMALLGYGTLVLASLYFTSDALMTMSGDSIHFTREISNDLLGRWFQAGGLEAHPFYDADTDNDWGWIFGDHISLVHPWLVVPLMWAVGGWIFLPGVWVLISISLAALAITYAVNALKLNVTNAVFVCGIVFLRAHVALSNNSSVFITKGYPDSLSAPLILVIAVAALSKSRGVLIVSIVLLALTKETYVLPAIFFSALVFPYDRRASVLPVGFLSVYAVTAMLVIPFAIGVTPHMLALANAELSGGGNSTSNLLSNRALLVEVGLILPMAILAVKGFLMPGQRLFVAVFVLVGGMFGVGAIFNGLTGHTTIALVGVFAGLALRLMWEGGSLPVLIHGAVAASIVVGVAALSVISLDVVRSMNQVSSSDFEEIRAIHAAIPLESAVSVNVDRMRESLLSSRIGYYRFPDGLDSVEYVVLPSADAETPANLFFPYGTQGDECTDCRTLASDRAHAISMGFTVQRQFEHYEIWQRR